LDRYRPYYGRSRSGHHRRSTSGSSNDSTTRKRSIKLAVCAGIFLVAVLFKLVFPDTMAAVGEKITAVIDYKSALTVLGQGISGEKKFTTALGEAFTYAFSGGLPEEQSDESKENVQVSEFTGLAVGAAAAGDSSAIEAENGDSVQTGSFSNELPAGEADGSIPSDSADNADTAEAAETENLSDAVIAAFLESQEEYSDYSIPAGVTYDMPLISMDYTTPIQGVVSSPFGYRIHPRDGEVKFHYGIDIEAADGTPINSFADGVVTAVGESTTLGNYLIIKHGEVETEYAHCSEICIKDGQTVKKGEKVAVIGSTGNATSTCLHFEMRVNDVCVNPGYYLSWD
jgi:murein DD-endopeptidase MepM/ murein hydrolase activator NlpD